MGVLILDKDFAQPPRPSLRRWTAAASGWILVAAGLWAVVNLAGILRATTGRTTAVPRDYGWLDIQPSRDLQWHSCYGGSFDCARLDLPMDWLEPSDKLRVYLAVIRLRAKTSEDYRGAVFVNPGGPGGSGVDFLADQGKALQTIIGENHDIISFDPRGVYASVPRIDCWGSAHMRHDWDRSFVDVVDAYPGLVYESYARADTFSRQCEAHMSSGDVMAGLLLEHISTASHARDMLAIAEAAGESRLKYWGISYGSILGGTFAAMFPDRVERLVSDGNVDYASWYRNDQRNFFEDTDSIMEAFFHFCHEVGPDRCEFDVPGPQGSAGAIQDKFFALLEHIKKKPVLIPAGAFDADKKLPMLPKLVTYSELQVLIRTVLYKPLQHFPALATALAALERGDGRPFYAMTGESEPLHLFCSPDEVSSPILSMPPMPSSSGFLRPAAGDDDSNWGDVFSAITCADGDIVTDSAEDFAEYAAELQNVSRYAGAAYSHFRRGCIGRQIRPRYRYPAPWPGPVRNTSFPILFIGNTADNVTPLSSARRNAAVFPGSVVLVQKSWGHATVAAPSTCTAKAIHAYFQQGELPAPETYCEQDYQLFDSPELMLQGEQAEDAISRAVRQLSRKVSFGHKGSL